MEYLKVKQIPYCTKYFYMFMMFMWVARTTPLTSFKLGENPILVPIYLFILGYFYVKYCRLTYKPLIVLLSIFAVWYIFSCVKYGGMQGFYFLPVYNIIIAHVAFNLYKKEEFLVLFEKILVQLCILSLMVWAGANLLPSIVPKIMHALAVYENHPPTETNSIIVGMGSQFTMGIRRNIGFTWEPGRFSCFILLGLFLNLVRKRFQIYPIKSNKSFYILLVSLVSTLSTTGYSAFCVIVFFYILNISTKAKSLVIILSLLILPYIFSLSFMSDKITSLFDINQEISSIYYHYYEVGMEEIVPQRFGGLYFDLQNLIHDFWLGYNQNENSYIQKDFFNGIAVWMSDGVIQIISKYGIFIGLFFYYWLIKSSKYFSEVFHYKGKYIYAVLFVLISFSYDFWENCIFMYLYFSTFYMKYSNRYF